MLRQRKLNQYSVYLAVGVERVDELHELLLGGLRRKCVLVALYAADLARFLLVVYIHAACRVVAYDNYCKSNIETLAFYLLAYLFLYLCGYCLSVNYLCCHFTAPRFRQMFL